MRQYLPERSVDSIVFVDLIETFSEYVRSNIVTTGDIETDHNIYISTLLTLNRWFERAPVRYVKVTLDDILSCTTLYRLSQKQCNIDYKHLVALHALKILTLFRNELRELVYSNDSFTLFRNIGGTQYYELQSY